MSVRVKAGLAALAVAALAGAAIPGCDRCYDVPAAQERWLTTELRGSYGRCDMALHVDDAAASAAVATCLLDHFRRCEEARGTIITPSAAADGDWEYRDIYVLDTCEVVVLAFPGTGDGTWRESICADLEAAASPRHVEVARCSDRDFDPC